MFASRPLDARVLAGRVAVADDPSPRRPNIDRNSPVSCRPDEDRDLALADGRRPNATRMAETTPTQPPDADMWSDADISVAIGGNVAMPVGAISPRLA
jgi:hypothetical protein